MKHVVIRSKPGRGVLVLFTNNTQKQIEILLQLREKSSGNRYLIAKRQTANLF